MRYDPALDERLVLALPVNQKNRSDYLNCYSGSPWYVHDLESFYKVTHNACRYTETRAPAPAVVQEFVQAWKQLRRVTGRS